MLTILLVSLLNLHSAFARMGGGELGPYIPPCDIGQVNKCQDDERAASANSRAAGEALAPQINAISPRVARLTTDRDQAQIRSDTAMSIELMVKDEIEFLSEPAEPASPEILPGFASAEDFFSLNSSERTWQERYPDERARALNSQLSEIGAQEVECKNQLQEISTQFGTLNGQYQSLVSQQANLFADANAHENMSSTGCHQRMCAR
jgi:hypothetical protein